jgi:hypothetical protein
MADALTIHRKTGLRTTKKLYDAIATLGIPEEEVKRLQAMCVASNKAIASLDSEARSKIRQEKINRRILIEAVRSERLDRVAHGIKYRILNPHPPTTADACTPVHVLLLAGAFVLDKHRLMLEGHPAKGDLFERARTNANTLVRAMESLVVPGDQRSSGVESILTTLR